MTVDSGKIPVWLWVIWALALVYHLLTIEISPMPWFDETYFASMTLHFQKTGEFMPQIGPMLEYYYPQSKAYGPAYFLVIAASFKVFGFGMIQMRIPALLFGFFSIPVVYKILGLSNIQAGFRNFVFVLALFDPIYLQNIHSGRMDSMALFFAFGGIYFLLKGFSQNSFIFYLGCGLSFGVALLTTPRIAVSLIGPVVALILFFFSKPTTKQFFFSLSVAILIAALYSIWVFWGFGGYQEAYQYFFGKPKEVLYFKSLADGYISYKKYIPVFQIPVLIILGVFISLTVYYRRAMVWIFWISMFNLVAFYTMVNDTGIYSIFSMPWAYICLACIGQSFTLFVFQEKMLKIGMIGLVALNVSIFTLKNTVIWLFAASRDTEIVQKQVSQLIPKGSRVIGDEAYYYFVMKAGSDFQYLDRGASTPQRIDYHKNQYKYDYIIVRNPAANPFELEWYFKSQTHKEVGSILVPRSGNTAQNLSSLLSKIKIEVPKGYEGKIYKR